MTGSARRGGDWTNAVDEGREVGAGRCCLRVVYIDDDPLAIGALTALAASCPRLRVEAVSMDSAVEDLSVEGDDPCLVLIDLLLYRDGADGIDVAQEIMRAHPSLRIALCTVSESAADAGRAWAAGIHAYLTKHHLLRRSDDLAAILWNVYDGAVIYQIDPRGGRQLSPLSDREIEILQRKCDGEAHRHIAEDLYLSVRTIDSHLANARAKLQATSVQDALRIAEDLSLIRRRTR